MVFLDRGSDAARRADLQAAGSLTIRRTNCGGPSLCSVPVHRTSHVAITIAIAIAIDGCWMLDAVKDRRTELQPTDHTDGHRFHRTRTFQHRGIEPSQMNRAFCRAFVDLAPNGVPSFALFGYKSPIHGQMLNPNNAKGGFLGQLR